MAPDHVGEQQFGEPSWLAPSLHVTPGRDPLGLQTITQHRIMPMLAPGILALSRRARYLSFYTFLLDEYATRKLPPSNAALGKFLLAREYELALAIEFCPRQCGSIPVGRDRSGPEAKLNKKLYERGESVESPLAGYGLYYRTPLSSFGIVALAGTGLGDSKTPIDVLVPSERSKILAKTFRDAIRDTTYYKKHFVGLNPVPRSALTGYAERACLCQLDENSREQGLLREVMFDSPRESLDSEFQQRRRAFATFLEALQSDPKVATNPFIFRSRLLEGFTSSKDSPAPRAESLAEWAALVLKEYMQEALSAAWIELCRYGIKNQPHDGFHPAQLRELLRGPVASASLQIGEATVLAVPDESTALFQNAILDVTSDLSLEDIRAWSRREGRAVGGLALLLVLLDRLPSIDDLSETSRAFLDVGVQRSLRQSGLLHVLHALREHLELKPLLADTVEWLVRRNIIEVHERVAYSKLPNFTFRFRWESGRLRFYDNGIWPFDLADMRHGSLSQLSRDLGFWNETPAGATLTSVGRQFANQVFS